MSVWTDFFALPIGDGGDGGDGVAGGVGLPFKGALIVKSGVQSIANAVDVLRFWFDGTDYIKIGFEANVS